MDLTFTDARVSLGGLTRPLEAKDREVLASLAGLEPGATPKQLLYLGRELHAWLDGPARWLAHPPTDLVVRAPPGSVARHLPWELLADSEGHLASRGFSIVHRLTEPGQEPPSDDHRLGVLFMAAAPEGAVPLRFEDEEAAILRAIREPGAMLAVVDPSRLPPTELDLFGEDTGNLGELARRLDLLREHHLDVLHISGHGSSDPPKLLMEDPEGGHDWVEADQLVDTLRHHLPAIPLTFLSACETGKRGAADSLAELLVKGGAPAVLAWAMKVPDPDATVFAAWLYHYLGRGLRLDQSVAEARREMVRAGRRGWHLARLFLGRSRGGPLARPGGRARPVSAARDPYTLANVSGRPRPVCHEAAFVGRRRTLQRALRVLRSSDRRGIVLTGIGQQGKSSVAVRLGDRLRERLDMVLIWGRLDAHRLHAQLAEAFGQPLDLRAPVDHEGADRRLRVALEEWLRQDHRPILLILDDFEQNLEDIGTAWVPTPETWPVLTALLGAFAACPSSRSRLVVTSRVAFAVMDGQGRPLHDCLEVLPVAEMDAAERSRLRVQREVDARLRMRVEASGRGNPGLTEVLLRLAAEDPVECGWACDQLDATELPAGDIGTVLEDIALDKLIASAARSQGGHDLLQVARFFDLPVPASVLDGMMRELGFDHPEVPRHRLSALGLLEEHSAERHLALNALAAGRVPPLSHAEGEALAPMALNFLRGEALELDTGLAVQAFLLAAQLADADTLARTAETAVPALPTLDNPKRTAPLAVSACRVLLRQGRVPSPWTLMAAADQGSDVVEGVEDLLAAARSGLGDSDLYTTASLLVMEGRALLATGQPDEALTRLRGAEEKFRDIGDTRSRAITLGEIARIHLSKGEVDEALRLHLENLAVFEHLGDARSGALTLGDIARIHVNKGEVDEALRLYHEELAIYERLGDARCRAVTLGNVARIRVNKGEVDEALRLHLERLEVFEHLGDVRCRAIALADIARIRLNKGEVDEALRLQQGALAVFERLSDARSRPVTLGDIARIRLSKGEVDEALQLHHERLAVFERLGHAREHAQTLGDIACILANKGEFDEALRLHQEELAVFERLGDARERAVTLGYIARIRISKGEVDEALRLHRAALEIFERLREVHSRAVTLGDIARIHVDKDEVDEALRLHQEELAVYERLGAVRERAVTLGDIARIRIVKGEVDEALRLQQERLVLSRQLGDIDGIAEAQWELAKLDMQSENLPAAQARLDEAFCLLQRTGRVVGLAKVGTSFGQLLAAGGQRERAREVLEIAAEAWRCLDQQSKAEHVDALVASLAGAPNPLRVSLNWIEAGHRREGDPSRLPRRRRRAR